MDIAGEEMKTKTEKLIEKILNTETKGLNMGMKEAKTKLIFSYDDACELIEQAQAQTKLECLKKDEVHLTILLGELSEIIISKISKIQQEIKEMENGM